MHFVILTYASRLRQIPFSLLSIGRGIRLAGIISIHLVGYADIFD